MDPGTDASKILHNRIVPLRRVNRGQRNIDAGLSIRVGLRNEKRFFRTRRILHTPAEHDGIKTIHAVDIRRIRTPLHGVISEKGRKRILKEEGN